MAIKINRWEVPTSLLNIKYSILIIEDKMSETLTIPSDEKFIYVDSKSVDNKHRINLGAKIFSLYKRITPPDEFEIFVSANGDVLLKPKMKIPAKEKWLFENPKAFLQFQRGIQDVIDGNVTEVENINELIKSL